MFLSIIIPVYNAEKYLEECLQSCLDQDVEKEDYEIVCINDGSKDGSLPILQRCAQMHSNVLVIDQPNSGVSATRNRAMQVAKGDYIWFVDADDFIKPNCLARLKAAAANQDIVNFGAYAFAETFTAEEKQLFLEDRLPPNETYWGFACFHLYRNALIKENGLALNEAIKYGEDEVFYNDVYAVAERVIRLDETFYYYRQNPNSATNTVIDPKKLLIRAHSVLLSIEILKSGIESGRYTKGFSREFLAARYAALPHCFQSIPLKETRRLFKEMEERGLFDWEKLRDVHLMPKGEIKRTYLKYHLKIRFKAAYRKRRGVVHKCLPKALCNKLDRALHMN